jgi:hypothetical protein
MKKSVKNTKTFDMHWDKFLLPLSIVVALRLAGFLYMFIDPLVGILVSFVFDIVDAWIYYAFDLPHSHFYPYTDKTLDYVQYLLILPIAYQTPVFIYVLIAFIFRSVGDILVLITKKRIWFVLFPNFIEYILLIYIVIERFSLQVEWNNIYILSALVIFKVGIEILVHTTPYGSGWGSGLAWIPKFQKWAK